MTVNANSRLGISTAAGGPGIFSLGAPSPYVPQAAPSMVSTAKPYIAHLYNSKMTFKALLGPLVVSSASTQTIKWTLNSGFHPMTLEVPAVNSTISPGDCIFLSEQGGDGTFIFGGTVEDVPVVLGTGQASFQVYVVPFVSELGDGSVNLAYTVPTDLATMIHDAVASTVHCSIDFASCPPTGITAIVNFNNTSPLDVLNTCKKMAGQNYFWFCDQYGRVWFQPTGSTAYYTFTLGPDYNGFKRSQSIKYLRNSVFVVGGIPSGGSAPITATYTGGSISTYGKRAVQPNPLYPAITDFSTLNNVAQGIGQALDRVQNTIEVNAPQFKSRVVANLPGGPMMRYLEPSSQAQTQAYVGSGTYSSTFVGQDCETTAPSQKVIMGDVPVTAVNDLDYEIGRIIAAGSSDRAANPSPPNNSASVLQAGGYIVSKDLSGNIRAEFGNLPAYTDPRGVVSAQHYGIRNRDQIGNLIHDSIGLIGLMSLLQSATFTTASYTGAASDTVICSMSFTLTRVQSVLLISLPVGMITNTSPGVYGRGSNVYIQVGGQSASASGAIPQAPVRNSTGDTGSTTVMQVLNDLPAGTYTMNTYWKAWNGVNDSLSILDGQMLAFLLGG